MVVLRETYVAEVLGALLAESVGAEYNLFGHLKNHGHEDEKLLQDIVTDDVHGLVHLVHVWLQNRWVPVVFGVVYEDVVMVQLRCISDMLHELSRVKMHRLVKASLGPTLARWLEANVKTTGILLGCSFVWKLLVGRQCHDRMSKTHLRFIELIGNAMVGNCEEAVLGDGFE